MVALPAGRQTDITVEEYLALEAGSKVRHEYYDGEIIAMPGARRDHVRIASNINSSLDSQLERNPNCSTFASDLRVRVSETIYFYPDIIVACGETYTDSGQLMLTNPRVLAEVTSESTALYDRTTKLEAYKCLESVQDILVVDQYRVRVEQHSRIAEGWLVREYLALDDTLSLDSIGCTLAVSKIYSKVMFSA